MKYFLSLGSNIEPKKNLDLAIGALGKILDEMNILVKKDGFSNISEAVGSKNFQFLMDETDRSIFG